MKREFYQNEETIGESLNYFLQNVANFVMSGVKAISKSLSYRKISKSLNSRKTRKLLKSIQNVLPWGLLIGSFIILGYFIYRGRTSRFKSSKKAGDFSNRASANATSDGAPRRRAATASTEPDEPKLGEDYTSEQLEVVTKLEKCKDYYEILGVTKESTDSEIKKAYKKLALQMHPDKNKAPGSAEAFKAIGKAVAVLTDPEKRQSYDLYGQYEQQLARRNNGFKPPQQQAQTRYRRYNHQHEAQTGQASLAFGLILLFIIVAMLSYFFTSDPMYSLSPSSKYPIKRKTLNHRIVYYVKENFGTEYQGSLATLESAVKEEYIVNMKQACFIEKNYRETMMSSARSFGSRTAQYAAAQALKTPSCDRLYKLGVSGRY